MPALRKLSVAEWIPTKPLPASMAARNFFFPSGDIGCAGLGMIALSAQVAGGVEDEGVELVEIAVEDRAVLAANDLDARPSCPTWSTASPIR